MNHKIIEGLPYKLDPGDCLECDIFGKNIQECTVYCKDGHCLKRVIEPTRSVKLVAIRKHFGWFPQIKKLFEELFELILAMIKFDRENMKEEAADVIVVFSQLIYRILPVISEIVSIMDAKIDRTISRYEIEIGDEVD